MALDCCPDSAIKLNGIISWFPWLTRTLNNSLVLSPKELEELEELEEGGQKLITKEYFKKCGRNIEYFPGVKEFFSQINRYVKQADVGIERLVSDGGDAIGQRDVGQAAAACKRLGCDVRDAARNRDAGQADAIG